MPKWLVKAAPRGTSSHEASRDRRATNIKSKISSCVFYNNTAGTRILPARRRVAVRKFSPARPGPVNTSLDAEMASIPVPVHEGEL